MVRITSVKKFVDSRNELLFRCSIYRRTGSGPLSSQSTFAGNGLCSLLNGSCHLGNNVNHRFKSTTSEASLKPRSSPLPPIKPKKSKVIKTTVTEITTSSSSVKQESVGLFRKKNLTDFVTNSTIKNVKMPVVNERPILFTPNVDFEINLAKNTALLVNLFKSYETFLLATAKPVIDIDEVLPEPSPANKPSKSETSDIELQKVYENPNQIDNRKYQTSLTQSLKSYINACITNDMSERAFSVLNEYRKKMLNNTKLLKCDDPELYADLMTKYAAKKNWSKVNEIYSMIVEENVPITPQVYMMMLDCLGRSPGNSKLIKKCIEMAAQKGISINDIMDKSTFMNDQRTHVLAAIRRHSPNFIPVYTSPQLEYDNELLNDMNKYIQPIEAKPHETLAPGTGCEISNSKFGFSAEQLHEYAENQFRLEAEGRVTVKNIAMLDSEYIDQNVLNNRKLLDTLLNQWRSDVVSAIKKKLSILQHRMRIDSTKKLNIYPYLKLLTPEEYAEILLDYLKTLVQGSEMYSQTVVYIYSTIGRKVMQKHRVNLCNESGVNQKINDLHKIYREILCSGKCSENPRQLWQRIIHHARGDGPCYLQKNVVWPWSVQVNVGRMLFKVLLENIKIDANLFQHQKGVDHVPVMYSLFRNRDLKSREEIRIHPTFVTLYRKSKIDTINFNANEIPMLCPTVPWTSFDSGGYLISSSDLIRLPSECTKQMKMIQKAPPRQMYPALDTLNQLGSVPWQINTRILDLAIKIFNLGGDEELHVPLTPDSMLTDQQLAYRGMTRNDMLEQKKSADRHYGQQQMDMFSMYSDTLYKLSLANHFRDRPFWLPHNMDFRGRTYPIPPHLTHLSADLTRSMLCFHQKQPLGRSGLDWLKLHCINLTGLKKRESVQDRLMYAESVIHDIIDSADNPLDGKQWWLNSDDPWQTLAACMEIADAIRSPDPKEFMSSFPIHQDGSCNGLQHYAALGRDVDGAASVNLAPASVPQDVYSTIANRVEEQRQRDAANGDPIAIELDGLIKRKIIKQTVMTTVYGVTHYGAQLQIKKQLRNIDFNPKLIDKAAKYLCKATFGSLSETFSSAREIQDWFTACAAFISKQNKEHVEWTSPLGLPIIQPYTRGMSFLSNVSLTKLVATDAKVNKMKEKNAFSPNFIHSLDSCHMMLTSLNCERAGTTFVSVHDCFWTHANTVPIMNRICREQFVLLHSQPILENLGDGFYQRYGITTQVPKKGKKSKNSEEIEAIDENVDTKDLFRRIPQKGRFDLKKVLKSIYFFS